MVICPIAIAVGCKKCPVFAVCPVKTVIGDYRPDAHVDAPARAKTAKSPSAAKAKPASNRKGARARRPRK
jgi:hypothetical protein